MTFGHRHICQKNAHQNISMHPFGYENNFFLWSAENFEQYTHDRDEDLSSECLSVTGK